LSWSWYFLFMRQMVLYRRERQSWLPFRFSEGKKKICFKTHLFFCSNTGWWRWCLIFWMVKTLWFFFALAKPSKSPPKGERRVKGKFSTTFCPLRKKSYHSYWQWGRNFVLRNFLVVCGCDFPFFLSKCPKGSTRCHTTPGHSHCASKKRVFADSIEKLNFNQI